MQEIHVIQPVKIIVKVTENYRKKTIAEIQSALEIIDNQMQQMEFQSRRMLNELEKKNPGGLAAARQHLERERAINQDSRQKLLDKIKSVQEMPLGQEIMQGQMEGLLQIAVGDYLDPLNPGREIVLEDGQVVAIRPSLPTTDKSGDK